MTLMTLATSTSMMTALPAFIFRRLSAAVADTTTAVALAVVAVLLAVTVLCLLAWLRSIERRVARLEALRAAGSGAAGSWAECGGEYDPDPR